MENQIIQEQELMLVEPANSQPFSDGFVWIKHAFSLTGKQFWRWMLISFIMNLCVVVVSTALTFASDSVVLSFIAQILSNVLTVLFTGGLIMGMAALAEEDDLEINHLFAAFQSKWQDLLILMLCFVPIVMLLVGVGVAAFFILAGGNTNNIMLFIPFLIVLYFLLAMMGFFTIPLVVLHDVKPIEAIKMSFSGSLKNIAPLIALGLGLVVIGLCVGFLFALLFGMFVGGNPTAATNMGMMGIILTLILIPFMLLLPIVNAGVMYAAYRNVWTNYPM